MNKYDELNNPKSCLSKAAPREMLFVLLARDPAAPAAIVEWVNARIRLGLNKPNDLKLEEAMLCAYEMHAEQITMPEKPDDFFIIRSADGRFWGGLRWVETKREACGFPTRRHAVRGLKTFVMVAAWGDVNPDTLSIRLFSEDVLPVYTSGI